MNAYFRKRAPGALARYEMIACEEGTCPCLRWRNSLGFIWLSTVHSRSVSSCVNACIVKLAMKGGRGFANPGQGDDAQIQGFLTNDRKETPISDASLVVADRTSMKNGPW